MGGQWYWYWRVVLEGDSLALGEALEEAVLEEEDAALEYSAALEASLVAAAVIEDVVEGML